jgi:hypothetical protein
MPIGINASKINTMVVDTHAIDIRKGGEVPVSILISNSRGSNLQGNRVRHKK